MALSLLAASSVALGQARDDEPARERVPARDATGPLGDAPAATIVVTGAASPVARDRIGNTLSVIEGRALASRGSAYLQDLLREVAGVAVSQSGSFGAPAQVRIRGAEGNHVLVLVDGVEVSAVGSGEMDFSSLLAGSIERVEILRGPQSGLYGSNALAGVINVITRGGDAPAFEAAAEYGAFDSLFGHAGVTLGDRETFISGSAVYRASDGFSSAAIGSEADGDRNLTLYLRGGARLGDIGRIDGSLRRVDKRSETDGFDFSGGPRQGLAVDDESHANIEDWSGGLGLAIEPVARWRTALAATYSHGTSAGAAGTGDAFGDTGARLKLAARSSYGFDSPSLAGAAHTITLFVEHEDESYRNTFPLDPSQRARLERAMLGYGAEYRIGIADAVFLRAAVRHDDNDAFADRTTFSLAGSWIIRPSGTRIHASYGTGVTNPTFFEQFGFIPGQFVGNAGLLPEKAQGFDIGVEQRLLGERIVVDVTYFTSTLEDEIVSAFPSVDNDIGTSDREGLELTARIELGRISLGGSYTYLDADDPDGTAEVRRPRHQASVDVSGRFGSADRGSFSAGLIHNGKMRDNDFRNYFTNGFTAEKTTLESYTVGRLSVAFRIAEAIELFGRLENAFAARYEEALSYGAPGRAAYAGLRFAVR